MLKQKEYINSLEKQLRAVKRESHESRFANSHCSSVDAGHASRKGQDRCASQQNRRSSLLIPKLDLSKVKGYEEPRQKHQQKQKMQTLQPNAEVNVKVNNFTGQGYTVSKQHKTIEHEQKIISHQKMQEHLSQSLTLSPPAPKKKQIQNAFKHDSADEISVSESYSQIQHRTASRTNNHHNNSTMIDSQNNAKRSADSCD